jgi:hypothetical protein
MRFVLECRDTMPHEHHVVAHVRSAANALVADAERRSFEKDADHFLGLLQRVPDHPPGEVSDDDVRTLLGLVDRAVDAIEDRIASGRDSGTVQQRLVKVVYASRAAMEEIHRWHKHYR